MTRRRNLALFVILCCAVILDGTSARAQGRSVAAVTGGLSHLRAVESPDSVEQPSAFDYSVAGIAGAALPLGDFADLSGGAAKPGFLVGIEGNLRTPIGLGWLTTLVAAVNSVDTAAVVWAFPPGTASVGTWGTIWALTGARYQFPVAESIELFGCGQIGLLYGNSPDVSGGPYGLHVDSESKTALAYGLGAGIMLGSTAYLQARYVHGTPHYRLPFAGPADADRQPTSLAWITGGLVF